MPLPANIQAAAKANVMKQKSPVWKGPEKDGVTFSMLSKFFVCRERFKALVVGGLKPAEAFHHRIEYGSLWHVCEEAHARGDGGWEDDLSNYAQGLLRKYPMQQAEVNKWYQICRAQFPVYMDHWNKHPDTTKRKPHLQEHVFDVPYLLPSGRTIRLRGKFDSVDLIDKKLYLMENKTKGDIYEPLIKKQLLFDLQTMMYLVALAFGENYGYESEGHLASDVPPYPIGGVRYNVVRRPLAGGKGTITQHKATGGAKCPKCKGEAPVGCPKCRGAGRIGGKPAETDAAFYARLEQVFRDDPGHFFMRWRCEVTQADIRRFCKLSLDPILEQLCTWWAEVTSDKKHLAQYRDKTPMQYRMPYGVYSPLLDGGATDLDNYLDTGSTAGLRRVDDLFPELKE